MNKGLEALESGIEINTKEYGNCIAYTQDCIDIIEKGLDRLEKLEKIFSDSHICEIKERFNEIECSADKCDNCPLGIGDGICLKKTFERKWELQKENQELIKKADCCLWKDCNKISQENQELKLDNKILKGMYEDIRTTANFYMSKCEKLENTIEIIKNKGIDYHSISAIKQSKDYEDYLDLVKNLIIVVFKLTKREYEILKEAL